MKIGTSPYKILWKTISIMKTNALRKVKTKKEKMKIKTFD